MDVSSIIRFNFLLLFFSKFSLDQREIETELFFGLRSAVIRACLSTRRKRNDDCVCQRGLGELRPARESGDDAGIEENDEIERKSPE